MKNLWDRFKSFGKLKALIVATILADAVIVSVIANIFTDVGYLLAFEIAAIADILIVIVFRRGIFNRVSSFLYSEVEDETYYGYDEEEEDFPRDEEPIDDEYIEEDSKIDTDKDEIIN